ncbi:beta-lactamase family protein [Nonomuraea composti]|uniref:beta-lactamase family protein n=1 Tax=Nonomuraea composti TaxID=2720023 RepID=UPI001F0D6DDB|nr:beta-lactamase family protein [Nonomuraea sp. FMUSA5-5]
MDPHEIRAALAIMKNGKIVLARGYTYDDRSRLPVVPTSTSLFRVASLSKSITTAAVMRLA